MEGIINYLMHYQMVLTNEQQWGQLMALSKHFIKINLHLEDEEQFKMTRRKF